MKKNLAKKKSLIYFKEKPPKISIFFLNASSLEDGLQLLALAPPPKQRALVEELGENAAAAPHVHGGVVASGEQQLRGAVPEGYDLKDEKNKSYEKE